MESAISSTTSATILTLSKTLCLDHSRYYLSTTRSFPSQLTRTFLSRRFVSFLPSASSLPRIFSSAVPSGLRCVSSSAASFASGGGGVAGGEIGGGGGGGGGGDGEKAIAVVDVFESSADVIILDVGGMSCGGCAASVKRILESQPQVSSASVNLTTETAVVWPISEAKVVPNWQKSLGVQLAKHLTSCGFKSNLRGEGFTEGDIPSKNTKDFL